MKIFCIYLISICLFINVSAQSLSVNDEGSSVSFVIKNFGIKTTGSLKGLKGNITFNPKELAKSVINVSVNTNTIDTDNRARDKHLAKAEYFDVIKFPTINFLSTKITESNIPNRFFVVANLTIKGITKQVQFGFTATSVSTGWLLMGNFDINRRDFAVGDKSFALAEMLKVSLSVTAKN